MECGMRMRAVATQRTISSPLGGSASSIGVPFTATNAFTGTLSGCSGRVASVCTYTTQGRVDTNITPPLLRIAGFELHRLHLASDALHPCVMLWMLRAMLWMFVMWMLRAMLWMFVMWMFRAMLWMLRAIMLMCLALRECV